MNDESAREKYLTNFERNNKPDEIFKGSVTHAGKEIVRLLKTEDLTYDQAYASLKFAYNQLKYESNFLKLQ